MARKCLPVSISKVGGGLSDNNISLERAMSKDVFNSLLPTVIKAKPEDCNLLYETLLSQSNGTSRIDSLVYPRQFVEALAKYRDPTLGIKEFYDPIAKLDKQPEDRGTVDGKATSFDQVLVKILSDKKNDLTAFFVKLVDSNQGEISRGIDVDIVIDSARATFGKILSKDELNIFTDGLDSNNSSTLEFSEIISVLGVSMKDRTDRLKAYLCLIAAVLDKKKIATGNNSLFQRISSTLLEYFPKISTAKISSHKVPKRR